ncbi:glycosyltransferase [Prochlorothrix hollandica]|uniref:glycosyltransferase n=1 Tax=Prochlorothrix hollandica TaxID=1223 RepID=UPI00333F814E
MNVSPSPQCLTPPTGILQVPPLHRANSAPIAPPIQLSLIVPTYNEGGNVGKLITVLSALLDPVLPQGYELIIVDDDSPDRTWALAQGYLPDYPQLRVMRRQGERGLSSAVIRGWQGAQGEILGVIDGDLQHPPEVLLELLAQVRQGADLAVASRHIDGGGVSDWSLARRILSRGAQLLGLVLLPRAVGRVSDPMSGYFLVRRSAIAARPLQPLGYKILIEVLGRGTLDRVAEVPYVFQEREAGDSKVTAQQYWDYLHHLLRLRLTTGRFQGVKQRLRFPVKRFLQFGLVGSSGLLVDMGVLYLLFDGLGWGLTRSAVLAAELAIVNNFIWNDRWTFREFSQRQRQRRKTLKRFLKFNSICGLGLVLKILILNVFFNQLSLNAYIANFLAIALVTLWNFWLSVRLGWRVTQQ